MLWGAVVYVVERPTFGCGDPDCTRTVDVTERMWMGLVYKDCGCG